MLRGAGDRRVLPTAPSTRRLRSSRPMRTSSRSPS